LRFFSFSARCPFWITACKTKVRTVMFARVLFLIFPLALLAGCGGGGIVKATGDLNRGFDDLGCLSRDFKGQEPCSTEEN